jgi:hypothetical protein
MSVMPMAVATKVIVAAILAGDSDALPEMP